MPAGRRPVVALLTDYGPGSEHVGALHAVIAAACPEADRIDLAHDLPAGDVRAGAVVLARLAPLVPGAVVLAVVDPGVGTARRAVAAGLRDGGALVGPDNGLLGPAARALGAATCAVLPPPPADAPATFHGRDVLAPAAARLASGRSPADLGEPADPATIAAARPAGGRGPARRAAGDGGPGQPLRQRGAAGRRRRPRAARASRAATASTPPSASGATRSRWPGPSPTSRAAACWCTSTATGWSRWR